MAPQPTQAAHSGNTTMVTELEARLNQLAEKVDSNNDKLMEKVTKQEAVMQRMQDLLEKI